MSKSNSPPKVKTPAARSARLTLREQQAEMLAFCTGDYTVTRPGQETGLPPQTRTAAQHSPPRPR